MNILLIGDNRTNNNWGGRAATLAIYDLISAAGTINATIAISELSHHSAHTVYVGPLLSPRLSNLYKRAVDNSRHRFLFRAIAKVLALTGASDIVKQEPENTAKTILRYRKKYQFLDDLCCKIESSDTVVINGEGQLIFAQPTRRDPLFLLGLIALAKSFNKPVYYTNALVSDCPKTGRNQATFSAANRMFTLCEKVLVREQESHAIVSREMQDVNSEIVPDSLFSWSSLFINGRTLPPGNGNLIVPYPERQRYLNKLDFSKPYICIGGSAAADDHDQAVEAYVTLVEQFKKLGFRIYLTENDGRDSFLEEVARIADVGIVPVWTPIYAAASILANARLTITGRYHPSIMASLGGCPCIFIESVGHKLKSIQKLLEYDEIIEYPVHIKTTDAAAMSQRAQYLLDGGDVLRSRIQDRAAGLSRRTLTFREHIQSHNNGEAKNATAAERNIQVNQS